MQGKRSLFVQQGFTACSSPAHRVLGYIFKRDRHRLDHLRPTVSRRVKMSRQVVQCGVINAVT